MSFSFYRCAMAFPLQGELFQHLFYLQSFAECKQTVALVHPNTGIRMKSTVKKVLIVGVHAAKLQPIYNLLKQTIKAVNMTLVHWTYTKDEWKAFLRSTLKRKKTFYHLISLVLARRAKTVPEVCITPEKVWIGNNQQYFNSSKHELRQIDLRHDGFVNILLITYGRDGSNHEIRIPVPKGKLREAIEVQDRLMPHF